MSQLEVPRFLSLMKSILSQFFTTKYVFSFIPVEILADSPFFESGLVFASTTSLSVSRHDVRVSIQGLAVWIKAEYIPYLAMKGMLLDHQVLHIFRLRSFAMWRSTMMSLCRLQASGDGFV